MSEIREAIILAGGLGTRLSNILPDLPKCMAPINDKPFLEYLLEYLIKENITRVILSVGYKHEIIVNHFGENYKNLEIVYAIETEPLGTGGAIAFASQLTINNNFFVLNGDTFFTANLDELEKFHFKKKSNISIIVRQINDKLRYGTVITDDNYRIIGFKEKQINNDNIYINGGIYMINKNIFSIVNLDKKFSFEKDLLEKYYSSIPFYALDSKAYFIDIGIPEDYEKAINEIPLYIKVK